MGKRITLTILLLCILGGALWQNLYIVRATDELSASLKTVRTALEAQDDAAAASAAKTFIEHWNTEKHLYEALFEHDELDLLTSTAERIRVYCAIGDRDDALAEVAVAMYYVEHIRDIDCVSIENIF